MADVSERFSDIQEKLEASDVHVITHKKKKKKRKILLRIIDEWQLE